MSVIKKIRSTKIGADLIGNKRYRTIVIATLSLIFNLVLAFYYGILGVLSASIIFGASAVYYLLLAVMRFIAVLKRNDNSSTINHQTSAVIGIMLIVLSVVFQIMVIVSMKYETAASYGTITMITIATFTFTKITTAIVSAVKHRREKSIFIKSINAIRYSEIAVSVLTMQQSMLVSFGESTDSSTVILNACTGAGVCFFILALGIITLKHSHS